MDLDRKLGIEMGKKNPIYSIHDQGAGGLANVLKEIVYRFYIRFYI